MARIVEYESSMFDINSDALVNPVNCVGVIGAGLAKEFAWRFPNIIPPYKISCKDGTLKPGKILVCRESKYIVNFATKNHWRENSRYEFISEGMVELRRFLNTSQVRSIAFPKLGCGLGNLSYGTVKSIILRESESISDDIIVYLPPE